MNDNISKEEIIKSLLLERDEVLKLKNEAKLNKNKDLYISYKKKYFSISNRIDYITNKDKPEFKEMKNRNNYNYIYKPENYEKVKINSNVRYYNMKNNKLLNKIECC